ncbi:MAG: type II toxin-antitoxin system HicA family toxin [Candidatus Bipolaricaulota bacterium]|nr:type II toxin-antitoxin system HicA family toxin [Candidatus Bipolaricaulota bacterium]MCS7274009.1 type II toxin-antitoxin system HicA family toxin [Candidatus Bipolaricaulota bacterium]
MFPAKPEEVQRILEKLGFQRIRQSGSHVVYRHPDGRWTTLPIHSGKDVAKGTLRKIIRDLEITVDEFEALR